MILVHLGERAQWHDSKRPQGYWREAEKPLQNGCIIMIMTILYYTHRWLWESSHDSGILEFPRLLGKSWEWFFGVFCHPSSITQRVAPHPDFTFRFNDWVCLKMTPIYAIATGNMIELTIFFWVACFQSDTTDTLLQTMQRFCRRGTPPPTPFLEDTVDRHS